MEVDLSIKTPTNPNGDVDAKGIYNAFSDVAEYARLKRVWPHTIDAIAPQLHFHEY